ncbi:hypothetical protein DFH27DRAFT_80151 [Peziza echinospora]|nr:hypothetical protein DFH27DRAFT_80151 [Peziza echinospora]
MYSFVGDLLPLLLLDLLLEMGPALLLPFHQLVGIKGKKGKDYRPSKKKKKKKKITTCVTNWSSQLWRNLPIASNLQQLFGHCRYRYLDSCFKILVLRYLRLTLIVHSGSGGEANSGHEIVMMRHCHEIRVIHLLLPTPSSSYFARASTEARYTYFVSRCTTSR